MSLYELPVIELSGTYREMGEAIGEGFREEIISLCEGHYQWTQTILAQAGRDYSDHQLTETIYECIAHMKSFSPESYDEFYGIARAANISLEYLFLSHMTDIIDVLVFGGTWNRYGCSSVIVCGDRTATNNILLGQTWDWLTVDMPFFCLMHRKPQHGIENWSLGLFCSYSMGINVEGVVVGTTNLLTWDAAPGVPRSAIVQRALNSTTADSALKSIVNSQKASAHYHYLGDTKGIGYGVESSVRHTVISEHHQGFYVHCNHALNAEIKKYENTSPDASTLFRQQRLTQLLQTNSEITVSDLKNYFSDCEGGELGIRQDNTLGIYSTDACAIFSPQTGEFYACRGQADKGLWRHIKM
ncbi:C45 family autoproteolytic acyltransferase/hydolase [Candidatus Uabimicrobium amorphum]|uniref:Acyl-CoA--6-aminopenicillanic acidacyl-transferase n=1 Tax=Uabimicrobium amorphum TaxID=2596890 RepID=A0A5S9F1G1_UABAM|nr:C45 family peptidase [Candidatus Uabimicrobium amorphum]BBM82023.1 acyl-CoA--6-aminopenicillanic acidacyl-transferase [Candidatus Uabimicrobium amorphum]